MLRNQFKITKAIHELLL